MLNALAAAVTSSPRKLYGRWTGGRESNPTEGLSAMPDHTTNLNFNGPVQTVINNNHGTVNNHSSAEDDSEGDEDGGVNDEQCVSHKNGLPVIPGTLVKIRKGDIVKKEHLMANIKYLPHLCTKHALRKDLQSKLEAHQTIQWEPSHYDEFAKSLDRLHGEMIHMGMAAFEEFVAANFAREGFTLEGQGPKSFDDVKSIVASKAMMDMFHTDPMFVLQKFFICVMGCTTENSQFMTKGLPAHIKEAAAKYVPTPFYFNWCEGKGTTKTTRHPLGKLASSGVTEVKRKFSKWCKQTFGIALSLRREGRRDEDWEVEINLGREANPLGIKTYLVFPRNGDLGRHFTDEKPPTQSTVVSHLLTTMSSDGDVKSAQVGCLANRLTSQVLRDGIGRTDIYNALQRSFALQDKSGLMGRAPEEQYNMCYNPRDACGGEGCKSGSGGASNGSMAGDGPGQFGEGGGPNMGQGGRFQMSGAGGSFSASQGASMGQGRFQTSGAGGSFSESLGPGWQAGGPGPEAMEAVLTMMGFGQIQGGGGPSMDQGMTSPPSQGYRWEEGLSSSLDATPGPAEKISPGIFDSPVDDAAGPPCDGETVGIASSFKETGRQVSILDYSGDLVEKMLETQQCADPNATYPGLQFNGADTNAIDLELGRADMLKGIFDLVAIEGYWTEEEQVSVAQAIIPPRSNLASVCDRNDRNQEKEHDMVRNSGLFAERSHHSHCPDWQTNCFLACSMGSVVRNRRRKGSRSKGRSNLASFNLRRKEGGRRSNEGWRSSEGRRKSNSYEGWRSLLSLLQLITGAVNPASTPIWSGRAIIRASMVATLPMPLAWRSWK